MPADSFIPPIDETDKHAAFALYMGGFKAEEIVKELGVNMNTLRAWITRDGWFKQLEAIKAARNKKNPPQESPIVKLLHPDKAAENIQRFKELSGAMAVEDIEHWRQMDPQERIVVAPAITGLNKMHRENLEMNKQEETSKAAINITFLNNPNAVQIIQQNSTAPQLEEKTDE